MRLQGFSRDVVNHRQRDPVPSEHPADGQEANEAHEEAAHAIFRAADIRQLSEHYIEFSHYFMLDAFDVGKVRVFAQDRLGQIEAIAHAGLHGAAIRLVKGMDTFSHGTHLQTPCMKN
ncbi:hypothetical protein PCAR4_1600002 [Paraburkholderia caribensis]|nr:hypothetical protein PCAR4_1600002 [Paraburkholderia caribensis]